MTWISFIVGSFLMYLGLDMDFWREVAVVVGSGVLALSRIRWHEDDKH